MHRDADDVLICTQQFSRESGRQPENVMLFRTTQIFRREIGRDPSGVDNRDIDLNEISP